MNLKKKKQNLNLFILKDFYLNLYFNTIFNRQSRVLKRFRRNRFRNSLYKYLLLKKKFYLNKIKANSVKYLFFKFFFLRFKIFNYIFKSFFISHLRFFFF